MTLNDTLAVLYLASKTLALTAAMGCFATLMIDAFGFPLKKRIRPLLLGGIFLTATTHFFSTSYVPQETCFVAKNGSVAASFPHKTVLWAWNYYRLSQGKELFSYAHKEVEVAWANPIPAANIQITLIVEKIPMPETAARYYQALANVSSDVGVRTTEEYKFRRVVRTALVAFAELKSEKIAKFNDPSDDAQQQSFKRWTEESLNPLLLEKGMRVKHAEFEIEL